MQVALPGPDSVATPLSGVALFALPYDRDSVLAAMSAHRGTAPAMAGLDSIFARFRGPFQRYLAASEALDTARARAGRNAASGAMLADAERRAQAARAALDSARIALAGGDSLRAAYHRWEDSTYRGFDSVVRVLSRAQGASAVTDTTGPSGTVTMTLPHSRSGAWWVTATAWNAGDPNSEWYWNVNARGDTVRLDQHTGRSRPRY